MQLLLICFKQLRARANSAVMVYGALLNEQNVKYFCCNHEVSLIVELPELFFHIARCCESTVVRPVYDEHFAPQARRRHEATITKESGV